MKVRKLAVALALVGGLGSGVANALGLGEVELQSYLNEPLDAQIELSNSSDLSPNEVFVDLAPPQVFERVGIDRDFFLTNLSFNVVTAPNGQLVVNVTSRQAVREPYLNFLIEVTWPSGKLLREYSMLLDPQVYADQVGETPAQTVQAPASQPTRSTQAQASPRQESAATVSRSSGSSSARTFGPTGPSDTLWGIAQQVRPDASYSPQQVMLALQDLNPDAFIDGNINRLKRGQVLRIPSADQIEVRSNSQAVQEVIAQNNAFKQPQQSVDATGQQPGAVASTPADSGDELRLVADNDAVSPEEGAASGGADGVAGGAEGSTEVVMEQLDKAQRENADLNSRVEDLQSQLETMQRLVELKNAQLAELQAQAGDQPANVGAGQDGAAPAVDAAAAADESGEMSEADPLAAGETAPAGEETTGDMAAEGETEAMPTATGDDAAATAESSSDTMAADDEMTGDAQSSEPAAPVASEPSAAEPQDEELAQQPAAAEPVTEDEGFVANLMDQFMNNRQYQMVGGGVAILALLLVAMAARRRSREEPSLEDELDAGHGDDDTLDLGGAADHADEERDALAEADAYMAYGRTDQASEVLESAISREPSRSDLRLKLLAVYAESENRDAFEKQFAELEALDDESAMTEAQALRGKLEEAEATPSIDDLESQLRSGSAAEDKDEEDIFAGFESDDSTEAGEARTEDEFSESADDFSFDTLDLEEEPVEESKAAESTPEEAGDDAASDFDLTDLGLDDDEVAEPTTGESRPETASEDDLDFNFSLDDDLTEDEKSVADAEESLSEDDFGSLELDDSLLEGDLDDKAEASTSDRATSDDEAPALEEEPELASDEDGELDESFLDDLDAELEKVAGEEELGEKAGQDGWRLGRYAR
ncbi:FimV/HubP family polar landmark protein [Marinobacter sp. JSM 1782161]|uniref:FimV/HubP family polar landmark protein n=1 Tax=Marinobacter sp. JSM 1782161 TaxID=2685906 RepID=UPI001D19262D|nr:FimV/HubP family polar landmark protein [Marinobacter sp. JSM 1782161]